MCVSANVHLCLCQLGVGKPALLLSTGRKQRFEKSVELEQQGKCDEAGRVSCSNSNSTTHTPLHTAFCSYLMAGLTELTFADELSVQTQFESFPQKACKQKNKVRECIVHCCWEIQAFGIITGSQQHDLDVRISFL